MAKDGQAAGLCVRPAAPGDLAAMREIWNEVVDAGQAFPQEERLTPEGAAEFFAAQSACGVAEDGAGRVLGLYILHPNNVGRCGHIANASYAVAGHARPCAGEPCRGRAPRLPHPPVQRRGRGQRAGAASL